MFLGCRARMRTPTRAYPKCRNASTTSSAVATSSPGTSVGAPRTRNAAPVTNAAERPSSAQPVRDDDLGSCSFMTPYAMARLAAAHRPRLSFALSADDDPGAAELSRGADAGAATPRYVGCVRGRRIPRASPLGDLVLGFGLALLALVEIWWPGGLVATGPIEGDKAVLVPTALAMTLPLACRSRWPLATVLVVFGAAALQELLSTPPDGIAGVTALLIASYSVAAYSERRPAIVGLTGALAASLSGGVGDAAFAWVLIGGAWGAGRIVCRQNLLLDALAREQEARERAAVADERARLARELHDVVAHSVSMIVVQAEAGEALLEHDPDRARDAFVSVTSSGRQALGELRRMLGLLRSADGEPALGPQPGLSQLQALVEQMRGVGLPVELAIEGEPRRLP